MTVVQLSSNPPKKGRTLGDNSPNSTIIQIVIALVGVALSVGGSLWTVAENVGQFKKALEDTITEQKNEHEEYKHQTELLSGSVSSLVVSLAGVTVEIKNLNKAIENERQDRIYDEQRPSQGHH